MTSDNKEQPKQDNSSLSSSINNQSPQVQLSRPVTDESLISKIRDRMTAWADAIPHHGIKNLGYIIELDTVTELNSFQISLITVVEKRGDLQEKRKQYEGEQVLPAPMLKQRIQSIWDLPSGEPPETGEGVIENQVHDSFRKQKCLDCLGRPKHFCNVCRGKKNISCPECKGSGCATCSSTGTVPCPKCVGEGTSSCGVCGGSGEVLLFLSFQSTFSSSVTEKFIPNTSFPASFPIKKAKEHGTAQQTIDITARVFPEKTSGQKETESSVANGINDLIVKAAQSIKKDPGSRIARQRLRINGYPVWKAAYRFENKKYEMYFYGSSLNVYVEDNPIGDRQKKLIEQAQQAMQKGDWDNARAHVQQVLETEPTHVKALNMKHYLVKRNHRFMQLWGLAGGLVSGSIVLGFILYARHTSLNWLWSVIQAGIVSLVCGYGIGVIMGFIAFSLNTVSVRKWYIPFSCSAGFILVFFSVLMFIVRYDPIRKKDTEQYLQEFQQALPYGVPSVPWDDDIRFLRGLVKKFKPTGIDVGKAEKGLEKLKNLKNQKIKKAKKEKKKKDKIQANTKWKAWVSQKRKRNQAAFNKSMEQYENLILQKKLKTTSQKRSYLSALIKKYKKKGIDISKAYKELKRLK